VAVREDDRRRPSVVAGFHVPCVDWLQQVRVEVVQLGDEVTVGGERDGEP